MLHAPVRIGVFIYRQRRFAWLAQVESFSARPATMGLERERFEQEIERTMGLRSTDIRRPALRAERLVTLFRELVFVVQISHPLPSLLPNVIASYLGHRASPASPV